MRAENVLNISILHFNRLHSEDLSTLRHLRVKQAYSLTLDLVITKCM